MCTAFAFPTKLLLSQPTGFLPSTLLILCLVPPEESENLCGVQFRVRRMLLFIDDVRKLKLL